MDIYDALVDGIRNNLPPPISLESYLESLQKQVKGLRLSYYATPVNVNYADKDIQAAYLLTYLPHYYQLIYNILLQDCPTIFDNKQTINLNFIGGGPGSEAYGAIKFIVNNCRWVKNINVNILDINGITWEYSHEIVNNHLVNSINKIIQINWRSLPFDILSKNDIVLYHNEFKKSNLLVIQNCLNEIASTSFEKLKNNIEAIFNIIPKSSFFLMSDLTSGARGIIKSIEHLLENKSAPNFIKSTLANSSSTSIISVHHRPSEIISKFLLKGTDGLIPRKYIKYDYSLISSNNGIEPSGEELGLEAIYQPLNFKNLDANDFIHTKVFIGIDFGTSCTVISLARLIDNKIDVVTIPIEQLDHLGGKSFSPLVPSVIALVNKNRLLIGKHAAEHKAILETGVNCWHSFKQLLKNLENTSYPNSSMLNKGEHKINNAYDALVLYFKYLKREVVHYLSDANLPLETEYAVSIPAGFSSLEKQTLKKCLINSGINCEDVPFIEEPNAALINYLFEENVHSKSELNKKILVLDIGAGTVDVSVMQLTVDFSGLNSKLLSVLRLGNIGSNLIDECVLQDIIKELKIKGSIPESLKIELLSHAEELKIKLCKNIPTDQSVAFKLFSKASSNDTVAFSIDPKFEKFGFTSWSISYKRFQDIMREYFEGDDDGHGLSITILSAIKTANLTIEDIDQIIVSGGGARNPYIKNFVAELFGADKVVIPDNIQEQVSRGTALHSFVINSFGKSIITPILSHDVFIEDETVYVKLFKTGESIPSIDYEILVNEQEYDIKQYILSYYSKAELNKKYFEIPENTFVVKLVFYLDPDQELKCDIVTKKSVVHANEFYEVANPQYLNLNQ
jgi:molecular chaperone DnaK (HSP70)